MVYSAIRDKALENLYDNYDRIYKHINILWSEQRNLINLILLQYLSDDEELCVNFPFKVLYEEKDKVCEVVSIYFNFEDEEIHFKLSCDGETYDVSIWSVKLGDLVEIVEHLRENDKK